MSDEYIDPQHCINADRYNVIYEMKYSLLLDGLKKHDENVVDLIEKVVERELLSKNGRRKELGKDPLSSWYREYALLQEVTKSALKIVSGDLTLSHTVEDIADFSVTSFYCISVNLGLVSEDDILPFWN